MRVWRSLSADQFERGDWNARECFEIKILLTLDESSLVLVVEVKLIFGHAHRRDVSLSIKFVNYVRFIHKLRIVFVIESFQLCVIGLSPERVDVILGNFGGG